MRLDCEHTGRQAGRQAGRQPGRQVGRQTDRQGKTRSILALNINMIQQSRKLCSKKFYTVGNVLAKHLLVNLVHC